MKKYDFKKLVLMGVAGASLTISSVTAAGAYDDNTYTPSQPKKTTTKNTKPAAQKNTSNTSNSNYSSNARGYNYTADNSLSNDPKPTPYRSNHPFDNRYATDDKAAVQGDDANFTLPSNGSNDARATSARQGTNNPQNRPSQNTWNNPSSTQPGKSSDELADDYNSYQQRMGNKNWYGNNANPSSSAPSPRSSDGVYYEDMTNQRNASNPYSNNNPASYGSNAYGSQQQQNQQYNTQPQAVGTPQPISAQQFQRNQQNQSQGRIIHSDNSYHGGGGGGCKTCGGGK